MKAREVKPGVFYADYGVNRYSGDDIAELARLAQASPAGKALYCLHHSETDNVHEMLFAYRKGVEYPIHKHMRSSESKLLLHGAAVLTLYDDDGKVSERIPMGTADSDKVCFVRVPPGVHHFFEIESDVCVYAEAKIGPFDPADNVMASFKPVR